MGQAIYADRFHLAWPPTTRGRHERVRHPRERVMEDVAYNRGTAGGHPDHRRLRLERGRCFPAQAAGVFTFSDILRRRGQSTAFANAGRLKARLADLGHRRRPPARPRPQRCPAPGSARDDAEHPTPAAGAPSSRRSSPPPSRTRSCRASTPTPSSPTSPGTGRSCSSASSATPGLPPRPGRRPPCRGRRDRHRPDALALRPPPQPQRRMRRPHRLAHHPDQLHLDRLQVDLVPQTPRELRQRPRPVVHAA
jgi:hypothetical protein